ncbi:hypothetical protein AUJ91_01110 [archaeon CG2_30_31_98]|nr:MAG: hypothetical protein AUJ91_01110 [archaeon CG2_30_31_98]
MIHNKKIAKICIIKNKDNKKCQQELSLTWRELSLAVIIVVFGFLFSTKEFLLFLNTLNPIYGFMLYYFILFLVLFVFSKFGFVIMNVKIQNIVQVIGSTMIAFAFFIVVGWESAYVQYITLGSYGEISNIFLQSEDGAVWYFWYNIIGIVNIELARLLTFVITPFVLVIVGGLLVTKRKLL